MRFAFLILWILTAVCCLLILSAGKGQGEVGKKYLALALVGSVLNINGLALFLVVLQQYSLLTLCLLMAIECLICILAGRRKEGFFSIGKKLCWHAPADRAALPIFVLLAVLYLAFPTQYLLGGRDPGIYVIHGVHIAKTGSIQYDTDEKLTELYGEYGDFIQPGYPALFSPVQYPEVGEEAGDISPQFMPMYPALLAVAYDLGGLTALFGTNGILTLASLLVIYLLVREFFNKKAAAASVLILGLCPAELWGARLTETELLAQLLFFLAIYIWLTGWRKGKNSYLIAAGFLLGFGIWNRIDMLIVGLGLFVAAAYSVIWNPEKRKAMAGTCLAYMGTAASAYLYLYWFSRAYYRIHIDNRSLPTALFINGVGLAMFVLAFLIARFGKGICEERCNLIHLLTVKRGPRIGLGIVLTAAFLYAYLIRSNFGQSDSFVQLSMIQYCWYTSVPLFLFMILGLLLLLRKKGMAADGYYGFLCMAGACIIAYIIDPAISADHIWAARRWVPVNIPSTVILGCYGWQELFSRKEKNIYRWLTGAGFIGIAAFMIGQSRTFLFTPMMKNLDKQYQTLADSMSDDVVYLTQDGEMASVLRYIYGKQVYRADVNQAEAMERYIEERGELYFVGDFPMSGISWERYEKRVSHFQILSGNYLEKTVGKYPQSLYERRLNGTVGKIVKQDSETIHLEEGHLRILNGFYDSEGNMAAAGQGGILFYGPYFPLDAGEYQIRMTWEGADSFSDAYLELVSDPDQRLIRKESVTAGEPVTMNFTLSKPVSNWEIRLYVGANSEVVCREVILEKIK